MSACVVTMCVCRRVPFETVARMAGAGLTFDQIRARTGCCGGCGTCEPYVRLVIETGAQALPLLSPAAAAAVLARTRADRPITNETGPGQAPGA